MLGRSQGDLRRQEGQRSRLSRARRNLGQVPEADSVSFLQVRAALQAREDMEGGRREAEGEGSGCLGFRAVPAPWRRRVTPARRSCGQQGLNGRLSGTGAPGAQAGPGGGVRPWARASKGAQLHQVIPGRAGGTRWPGFSLHQPVGAAAGAGQRRGWATEARHGRWVPPASDSSFPRLPARAPRPGARSGVEDGNCQAQGGTQNPANGWSTSQPLWPQPRGQSRPLLDHPLASEGLRPREEVKRGQSPRTRHVCEHSVPYLGVCLSPGGLGCWEEGGGGEVQS